MKMLSAEKVFRRSKDIEWCTLEGVAVLIDERENELVRFNGVGSAVWQALDGAQSVEAVTGKLLAGFDVPEKKLKKEVSQFLKSLLKMELIETVPF